MESTPVLSNGLLEKEKEDVLVNNYVSLVDPFLIEALQNPRHRLTSWVSLLLLFNFAFTNLILLDFVIWVCG